LELGNPYFSLEAEYITKPSKTVAKELISNKKGIIARKKAEIKMLEEYLK
jgi:hypothetical protein